MHDEIMQEIFQVVSIPAIFLGQKISSKLLENIKIGQYTLTMAVFFFLRKGLSEVVKGLRH